MKILTVDDDACDSAIAGKKMLNISEGKNLRAAPELATDRHCLREGNSTGASGFQYAPPPCRREERYNFASTISSGKIDYIRWERNT